MLKKSAYKQVALCITWCVLCVSNLYAAQAGFASHLRPPHRAILQKWLAGKGDLRLATPEDGKVEEVLIRIRRERGRNYHPYYAVGDFNRDGKQDFAVVLVNRRKTAGNFAVAVFNGNFSKSKSIVPAYFNEGFETGDMLFKSGNRLLIGPYESDNCLILQPRGRGYVARDCLADAS